MRRWAFNIYKRMVDFVAAPAIMEFFLRNEVGREYSVGLFQKLWLVRRIRRNIRNIAGATSYYEHLLSLPRSVEGDLVECGCFKGRSTATLSLLCSLTGRRLMVFDSFEGLPDVGEEDRVHVSPILRRYEVYKRGDYAGSVEEVRRTVSKYGSVDRCLFNKGYFEESLRTFSGSVSFVFLDVDLHASLKACLLYLWPRLTEGGVVMTHEAKQLSVASIFFDRVWWRETLGCDAPGLIGAGTGLPAGISNSTGLAYAVKPSLNEQVIERSDFRYFCGDPTQSACTHF